MRNETSAALPASSADVPESATYRLLKWRLIPFLMLCYVVAYLDRVNVGFAKLQMLGDLRFSETVYGVGAGIFFIGYILFGVPGNLLMRRIGAKAWIAVIMVIWSVISGLMAFVNTPAQFFILRFLLGAVEAGFYPGVILYLTYWFPSSHRTRAVSMFQSAIPLSGLLGGPLSGWILDHLDGEEYLRGWQWLFLIEALPALAAGVAVWFYLDDGVAQARWLSASQKDTLLGNIAREDALKEPVLVQEILTDPRVWRQCILVFGLTMAVYAISFWMPTLLEGEGSPSGIAIGWLSAIPNLVALIGMTLFARSSDIQGERRWHVAGAAFLGSIGLASSVIFSHHLTAALFSLCLAATGIMSALPMQWSFATAFLGGPGLAAAIGLINSVGNLGGAISSPLIGWIKDRTYSTDLGMLLIAACALLSGIVALRFPAQLVNK